MKKRAIVKESQITFLCPKCGEEIIDKKPTYSPWSYESEARMESDAGIDVIVYCPNCKKTFEAILL